MAKAFVGKAVGTTVRFPGGRTSIVYAGQPVPDGADPDDVKRLAAEGYIVEVAASDVGGVQDPGSSGSTGDQAPPGNASTDTWAQYARGLGLAVPEGANRDEIKALVAESQKD